MPPAIPNTPERNEVNTIVAPRMASTERVMVLEADQAERASAPSIMSIVFWIP